MQKSQPIKKKLWKIFEIQTIFEHLIKSLLVQKLKFSLMETFRIQYDKYYKSHQFISSHRPKKKTQGFQLHDRILIKKLKIYKQGTHRRSDPIFRFQSNPNPQSCCKTKQKKKKIIES